LMCYCYARVCHESRAAIQISKVPACENFESR